jgi:hypothetical protein
MKIREINACYNLSRYRQHYLIHPRRPELRIELLYVSSEFTDSFALFYDLLPLKLILDLDRMVSKAPLLELIWVLPIRVSPLWKASRRKLSKTESTLPWEIFIT